ncbi:hypothetical protein Glove_134g160 [Diversispora epigaea]|uniref:Uncharacterized protein n=1 Tax=Diversispora epigaea TaxID=1348612 RepID=A0A397J1M1_9GLOM|nr:hypothetical protein Glove_134g160 [Diversispora epigaea]
MGNNGFNYNFLIEEREKHDAYNSCPILRQLRTSKFQNSNSENSIQPNKASHIVTYFVNNDNRNQNFIKQRENRWKYNHQTMVTSIANHNNEKNQQSYSEKRNTIPYISNIDNANINEEFPLTQNDFVFCSYSEKICIKQVLALYYENYNNHSFNVNSVTKIDDISKVTLKVFLPISSNLFAQYTPEECIIFTHRNPSNIIFYISSNDVNINDQFLFLLDKAKDYYNYFKRNDVINFILENNH